MGITFNLGVDELWVRDVSLDIDRRGGIIFNLCVDELQVASVEQEMERREKELHSEVVELRRSVENGRLQLARQEKLLAESAREKQDVLERLAGSQANVQDLQEQIGQRDVELKLLQDSKAKLEEEVSLNVGYFEGTVSELQRAIGLKEEETEALRSERSAERVSRRMRACFLLRIRPRCVNTAPPPVDWRLLFAVLVSATWGLLSPFLK